MKEFSSAHFHHHISRLGERTFWTGGGGGGRVIPCVSCWSVVSTSFPGPSPPYPKSPGNEVGVVCGFWAILPCCCLCPSPSPPPPPFLPFLLTSLGRARVGPQGVESRAPLDCAKKPLGKIVLLVVFSFSFRYLQSTTGARCRDAFWLTIASIMDTIAKKAKNRANIQEIILQFASQKTILGDSSRRRVIWVPSDNLGWQSNSTSLKRDLEWNLRHIFLVSRRKTIVLKSHNLSLLLPFFVVFVAQKQPTPAEVDKKNISAPAVGPDKQSF